MAKRKKTEEEIPETSKKKSKSVKETGAAAESAAKPSKAAKTPKTAPVKTTADEKPREEKSKSGTAKKAATTDKSKGMDLLISFDTTGSMNQVIASVRREVQRFIQETHEIDPDIRIGIIVHGDYCDEGRPYTIMAMDFTTDADTLKAFVRDTKSTYGGDADECYELVLRTARTNFDWRAGTRKVMVLIGDADPHEVGYRYKSVLNEIDWRNETKLLAEMGVQIFSVHCMSYWNRSSSFYKSIAKTTGGAYLTLDAFNEVTDLILAASVSQYEEEKINRFVTMIKDKGRMTRSMARNLTTLTGRTFEVRGIRAIQEKGLVPVPAGRFQVIDVEHDMSIKDFVEENELPFKKGMGFYELTKAETVQPYKEIILEDRATGDMYSGAEAREYLGLQPQAVKGTGGMNEKVYASKTREYTVYIQSTSSNRRLVGGTRLLYEVEFK
jgi:hypothetical protein